MKRAILATLFCVCISSLYAGSSAIYSGPESDTLQQQVRKPMRLSGSKFYIEERLLSKTEALDLLSISPDLVRLYENGTSLRKTGTFLLVGGIIVMTGGIPVALYGILTSPTVYSGTTKIDYNGTYYVGMIIAGIGELMIDGAIVCKIVGKSQLRRSVANYNEILKQTGYRLGGFEYQMGLLDNGMFGIKVTF